LSVFVILQIKVQCLMLNNSTKLHENLDLRLIAEEMAEKFPFQVKHCTRLQSQP